MEEFLVWRKDWGMDIPVLDEQHMSLIAQLNQIAHESNELLNDPSKAQLCKDLLNNFLNEVRQHFQSEESVMEQVNFPDIFEHRREHAMLIADLQQLIWEISHGKETLGIDTLNEIKNWYVAHVTMDARDFSDFYHRRRTN